MEDKDYLQIAIGKAEQSLDEGGFPAGSILVLNDMVVGEGISNGYELNDPTMHSDIAAIRQACERLGTSDLSGAVLYSSMQPCIMCFSAANWAGVSAIVYGCNKSPEMAKKGYYEGINQLDEVNRRNSRKIELDYIPDFETEILTLIKEWEEKNGI